MILTREQIASVLRGALKTYYDESIGALRADRFLPSQKEIIGQTHERNLYQTAGMRLDFMTDADALSMSCRYQRFTSRIFMSVDVYEDGVMIGSYRETDAFDKEGDTLRFPFEKKGKKRITVYLPYTLELIMDRVELENGTFVEPYVGYAARVLFIGDSITHGFDAEYTSYCYVNAASRQLGIDCVNQGIGGYMYKAASLGDAPVPGQTDAIVVAYGTNDWAGRTREDFERNIVEFYARLRELYPDVPVLCVTPVWRAGHYLTVKAGSFESACDFIACEAKKAGAAVLNGWQAVPHNGAFFRDVRLHPNDLGFASYAAAVADALRGLLK